METKEEISNKKKTLENYFGWKAKKWLHKKDQKRASNLKIKCKICLNDISFNIMNKHSEFCMKKKQLLNEVKLHQTNFSKFITVSENIIRNQKTLYRIEKSLFLVNL